MAARLRVVLQMMVVSGDAVAWLLPLSHAPGQAGHARALHYRRSPALWAPAGEHRSRSRPRASTTSNPEDSFADDVFESGPTTTTALFDLEDDLCFAEEVLGATSSRPVTIRRPADDVVLEALLMDFQRAALARPERYDQIMEGVGDAVVNRPRAWYWSKVWPSAKALHTWLAGEEVSTLFTDAAVLDLGCGVGPAGVAIGTHCRPRRVLFADVEPQAVRYACFNARANGLQDDSFEGVLLDWRSDDDATPSVDVVVCSDVLYDEEAIPHVGALIRSALRDRDRDDGFVVVADEVDRPYDHEQRLSALVSSLQSSGLPTTVDKSLVDVDWDDGPHRVCISLVRMSG